MNTLVKFVIYATAGVILFITDLAPLWTIGVAAGLDVFLSAVGLISWKKIFKSKGPEKIKGSLFLKSSEDALNFFKSEIQKKGFKVLPSSEEGVIYFEGTQELFEKSWGEDFMKISYVEGYEPPSEEEKVYVKGPEVRHLKPGDEAWMGVWNIFSNTYGTLYVSKTTKICKTQLDRDFVKVYRNSKGVFGVDFVDSKFENRTDYSWPRMSLDPYRFFKITELQT